MCSRIIKRGITVDWYRYICKAILLIRLRPSFSSIIERSFDDPITPVLGDYTRKARVVPLRAGVTPMYPVALGYRGVSFGVGSTLTRKHSAEPSSIGSPTWRKLRMVRSFTFSRILVAPRSHSRIRIFAKLSVLSDDA